MLFMKTKAKGKGVKGSFTVEAAILIPFITLIIMMIMFLCFHLYNSLISYHQASHAVLAANNTLNADADERISVAQREYYLNSKGTRISIENEKGSFKINGDKLELRYSYETISPFSGFMRDLIGKDYFIVEGSVSFSKINPVAATRNYRRIKDLVTDGKEKEKDNKRDNEEN